MKIPTRLSERRLSDLLKSLVKQCDSIPSERSAEDDPALTLMLARIAELSQTLAEAVALCNRHGLESEQFCTYRDEVDEFSASIVLPILARIEPPDAVRERYGPFEQSPSEELDSFRWTQLMGVLSGIRQYAGSVLRSVEANMKTAAGKKQREPSNTLNPPAIAKQLRVSPSTVIGWIRSGELKASNLGQPGKRARWAVSKEDLESFLDKRQPERRAPKTQRNSANSSKFY